MSTTIFCESNGKYYVAVLYESTDIIHCIISKKIVGLYLV